MAIIPTDLTMHDPTIMCKHQPVVRGDSRVEDRFLTACGEIQIDLFQRASSMANSPPSCNMLRPAPPITGDAAPPNVDIGAGTY